MSDPCRQEGAICGLQATVESIKESLERLSDGQDRFIAILEKISQQSEAITTLQKQQDELFKRIRQVELDASAERVKVGGLVATITIIVSTVTTLVVKHLGGK
jgi:predicted transcriptional regulator